MIPADLLDQLREKDPELWMEITRTELAEIEYCDVDGDECEPDYIYWAGLRSEAQDAWLQHCLQEAIRARGWDFKIEKYHNSIWGMIRIPNECWTDEVFKHKADTEAEALMRAYLSALSGERI